MTFLEYVCQKLMGPPAYRSSDRSYWNCPRHDDSSPSFCTRPPHPKFKDRFDCWGCGWWGDVHDLLKFFYPAESFGDRKVRLNAMRIDFEREGPELIHPGMGSTMPTDSDVKCCCYPEDDSTSEFEPKADKAAEEFLEHLGEMPSAKIFREVLLLVQHALEICAKHGLHPSVFASRVGFEAWSKGMDLEHLEEVGIGIADCDPKTCQASRCKGHREGRQATAKTNGRAGKRKRATA